MIAVRVVAPLGLTRALSLPGFPGTLIVADKGDGIACSAASAAG